MFAEHCVSGMGLNRRTIERYVENSLMLVTALSPKLGYDKAAQIAHCAHAQGLSLKEACLKLGYLSAAEFDALVKPETMTHP